MPRGRTCKTSAAGAWRLPRDSGPSCGRKWARSGKGRSWRRGCEGGEEIGYAEEWCTWAADDRSCAAFAAEEGAVWVGRGQETVAVAAAVVVAGHRMECLVEAVVVGPADHRPTEDIDCDP